MACMDCVPGSVACSLAPPDATLEHPVTTTFPHSCRECFNDCIAKLVSLADVQEKMTFGQALLRQHKEGKLKKITETTDSETFLATTGSKQQQQYATSDTVVQLYYIDTHSASRVYANLFTCKRLSDLHAGIHNKSFGFRLIRRILFIEDKMPDNFVKAYDEFATTRARSFHPHPDMRSKIQRYMLMESDYCGESILHARIKPSQAISIIGQVACTLAVAERELQFEHRNLHEENIKVQASTSKNQHFLLDDRICCVKGAGLKVTLFDDNFSRITYNDEVVMRMKNYNCLYREKTAIYLTMERIIKGQWHVFHPETNALWLAYLCGHLSDYLTVPNPSGDWQRKLEVLALMQRDLQRFRSADEFVWHYMNKLGHIHAGHDYLPHTWGGRENPSPLYSGLLHLLHWKERKHKEERATH